MTPDILLKGDTLHFRRFDHASRTRSQALTAGFTVQQPGAHGTLRPDTDFLLVGATPKWGWSIRALNPAALLWLQMNFPGD